MKNFLLLLLLLVLFSSNVSKIFARSGCCSYHGGVCGCGCCDGSSLSATCAPYYPSCSGGGDYVAPQPTLQNMPFSQATSTFISNDHGSYTVDFDWDRPNGGQWSVAISKSKAADPGSKTDTTVSEYSFNDIKPGTWYVNIKEGMPNGYWSDVSYYTVTAPAWSAPIQTPSPILSPSSKPNTMPDVQPTISSSDDSSILNLLTTAGLIGGGVWLAKQKSKN